MKKMIYYRLIPIFVFGILLFSGFFVPESGRNVHIVVATEEECSADSLYPQCTICRDTSGNTTNATVYEQCMLAASRAASGGGGESPRNSGGGGESPRPGGGGGESPSVDFKIENPLNAKSIDELIQALINIMIKIGIPIATLFIIYAGFLFVTARGSEEKITKAKTTLLWAIIGTAVLLGAMIIMSAIKGTVDKLES